MVAPYVVIANVSEHTCYSGFKDVLLVAADNEAFAQLNSRQLMAYFLFVHPAVLYS